MSDAYQAIYDATRSRLSNGDIGEAIRRAMPDMSYQVVRCQEAIIEAAHDVRAEMIRPSVLYRPALSIDGNMWCALYGADIQEGLAAFGTTPEQAMINFDVAFLNQRAGRDGGT